MTDGNEHLSCSCPTLTLRFPFRRPGAASTMIRDIVDSLFEKLLEAFPARRPYTQDDFQRDAMPAAIAHFLNRLLKERISREIEHLKMTRSEWVDYEAREVRRAQHAFASALEENAHVPVDQWEEALRRAVRLTTAYLTRPVTTLVDFVFQGEERTCSMPVIKQRIGFFKDYAYLHDIIERYADRKGVQEMERTRFASLLHRIDRQMVEDYGPDQWIRLLKPLFAQMEAVPATAGKGVPAALLQTFFEEKKADALARQLAAASSGQREWTPGRLRQLLESGKETRPAPDQEAAHLEKTASSPPPAQPAPDPQEEEGPLPLWKQFRPRSGGIPEKQKDRRTPSPPKKPSPSPSSPEKDVPRWKQFRAGSSEANKDELDALERKVLGRRGQSNRSLFLNQLFDGSREEYRRVLHKLSGIGSWSQASRIIGKEIFKKNKVNIYSDAAVAFTDAVQSRYREK